LAWVIGSIPLMSFNHKAESYKKLNTEWFKSEAMRCNGFLLQLDANPQPLEEALAHEGRELLGKRFEKFVEFWLRYSGRFEVLMSNVQLKQNKRTIGEIDYLVKELDSGDIWHLEVACKYYLGYNNSSLWTNWKGMNAVDTLEDKMTKFQKQLAIFSTELGAEFLSDHRIVKPTSYLMLKGQFFYHWKNIRNAKSPKFSNVNHNTGLYLNESEINEFFTGFNYWKVLRKHSWFSPFSASSDAGLIFEYDIEKTIKELIEKYRSGVMLARLRESNGMFKEDLRVVVVGNSWPNKSA